MFVTTLITLALSVSPTPTVADGAPPYISLIVPGFIDDAACQAAARTIATALRPSGGGQSVGSCIETAAPSEA